MFLPSQGALSRFHAVFVFFIRLEEEARKTAGQLDLAERLVNGLADERYRWANAIEDLNNKRNTLVGDCLIAAAFLSYIGPFSRKFREVRKISISFSICLPSYFRCCYSLFLSSYIYMLVLRVLDPVVKEENYRIIFLVCFLVYSQI